jgi:hypothetical protein
MSWTSGLSSVDTSLPPIDSKCLRQLSTPWKRSKAHEIDRQRRRHFSVDTWSVWGGSKCLRRSEAREHDYGRNAVFGRISDRPPSPQTEAVTATPAVLLQPITVREDYVWLTK